MICNLDFDIWIFKIMCLGIPQKIIKINGQKALVKGANGQKEIDIHMIFGLKVGDFVISQNAIAVNKIDKKTAFEIDELLK